jgi:hypothetical protein
MSASTAVKAIKKIKKAPKIVKKRTKTFFRFQSDRFDRVKVCFLFSTRLSYLIRLLGESPVVSIIEFEESSRVPFSCRRSVMDLERKLASSSRMVSTLS